MKNIELGKSAENIRSISIPKEVLNPLEASRRYTFRTYPASTALEPFIEYYWIMRWDLTTQPPFIAEVVPSPYTNLTFMREGARVTGVTTGKYTYKLNGHGAIVGVKFRPGGLYPFLKSDVHKLTNVFIPAVLVFPEIDTAYNHNILKSSDKKAVEVVKKLLLSKQPKADKNLKIIADILEYIAIARQPSLPDIIQLSGLSERRLQEIFRCQVGVGIKWIILRARLIKTVELAAISENPNWATIAQELGYSDQSHFINDFKRVVGKTPKQYAAKIGRPS